MRRRGAVLCVAALLVASGLMSLAPAGASGPEGTFGDPGEPPTFGTPQQDAFLATGDEDAGGPSAAEASRAITVTPDTDLVDGQEVTVAGTGFTDVSFVGIVQCAKGLGLDGCDLSTAAPSFDFVGGAFSETYYVSAVIDTDAGSIDCRTYVDGCRIMVNQRFDLTGSARADIAFDPAGPLEPPPSVAVDPSTDLVDRQVVHVTASGFRADESVVLGQCPVGTTDPTEGCGGQVGFATADANGEVSADLVVRASFRAYLGTGSTETDCRVTACEVAVAASDDYDRFGAAPVTFDPDAPLRPDMDVEVTPHTDLVDGQVVQLHGVGYTPDGPVDVVECSISSDLDGGGCELDRAQHLTADTDGEVDTTYAVNDLLDTESGPVDCRRSNQCILVAVDRSVPIDFGEGYRFVTLYFAGGEELPPSDPAAPTAVTPAFTG